MLGGVEGAEGVEGVEGLEGVRRLDEMRWESKGIMPDLIYMYKLLTECMGGRRMLTYAVAHFAWLLNCVTRKEQGRSWIIYLFSQRFGSRHLQRRALWCAGDIARHPKP